MDVFFFHCEVNLEACDNFFYIIMILITIKMGVLRIRGGTLWQYLIDLDILSKTVHWTIRFV